MNQSPTTVIAGIGAALLVLLVTVFLSFQRFLQLRTADVWHVHSYQVLLESSHLIRGLIGIQTGLREYLQTGDENYLASYRLGQKEYTEHYKNILQMTQDRPVQQKRLKLLDRQYGIWMNGHINPLIKMRRATRDTRTALKLAGPGKRKRQIVLDSMRKSITSIENTELELLQGRSNSVTQLQDSTRSALATNGIFAIFLSTGLAALLIAAARGLVSADRQLAEQSIQRERAEREMQILDRHNKMILLSAQEGIAGVNQAGRTTFFNPAAEAITGYTEAEVIGKSQHEILHSRRADGSPYPANECPINATLKDGQPRKADDEVFWRKDGRPIPVEFTSAPLMMPLEEGMDGAVESTDGTGAKTESPENRPLGAVIVFRDITERRKSEAALQEFASIVQYSDDSIIGLTLNGIVTRWNQAATKVYGYEPSEMIGQTISRLTPPEQADQLFDQLEQIKNLQPIDRYETVHCRKDGVPVEVVISLSPVVDQKGNVVGASSISREVFRSRMRREAQERGQNGGAPAIPPATTQI